MTAEKLLPVPLQHLAPGKRRTSWAWHCLLAWRSPHRRESPWGRARQARDQLLVADILSDDVLLMDAVTGNVLRRFDLSQGSVVPSTYPVAITVNPRALGLL